MEGIRGQQCQYNHHNMAAANKYFSGLHTASYVSWAVQQSLDLVGNTGHAIVVRASWTASWGPRGRGLGVGWAGGWVGVGA